MADHVIHEKLVEREKARVARDYAKSDRMRDELQAAGIFVKDSEKRWSANDGRSGPIPTASGGYGAGGGSARYRHDEPLWNPCGTPAEPLWSNTTLF